MAKHSLRTNVLLAALFTLTCCGTLNAQTWIGSTGNWSDASKWSGGSAPGSGPGTILTFRGSTSYTATNDIPTVPFNLNQLNFKTDDYVDITITGNQLRLAGTSALIKTEISYDTSYSIQSSIDFASDTAIQLNSDLYLSGELSGSGNITISSPFGVLILSGTATNNLTGNFTISGGGYVQIEDDSRLGSSNVILDNGRLIIQSPMTTTRTYTTANTSTFETNADMTINGKITGSGSLTKTGLGTLTLNNADNDYSGGSTYIKGGTLKLGSSTALPQGSGLLLFAKTTFDTNGFSPSIKTLNSNYTLAPTSIINSGSSITVGAGTSLGENVGTLHATISGSGSLIKSGDGFFELTAGNTYSGGTFINQGTFYVSNSSGSATGTGDVSLATLATLSGAGRITGNVTGSGTISPTNQTSGSSNGKLSLDGGLDLTTGGTYQWGLGALSVSNPGTDFDQISIAGGDLTLGGSSKLTLDFGALEADPNISNAFWDSPHTWTIIDVNSPGTNSFNNTFSEITNPTYSTGSFTLLDPTINGGDIVLSFTPNPVPEPTFILTATILGAIGGQVLRKRSKGKQSD